MDAATICMIAQFFNAQAKAPLAVPVSPVQVIEMAQASAKACEEAQKKEAKEKK